MMIVNGDTDSANPAVIWEGHADAALTVGTTYEFSAWVANVHPASPANLSFTVYLLAGDQLLATLSPSGVGVWENLHATFTADVENTGPFKLVNANFDYSGNDFAIDDIYIGLPQQHGVPDGGMSATLLGLGLLAIGLGRKLVK